MPGVDPRKFPTSPGEKGASRLAAIEARLAAIERNPATPVVKFSAYRNAALSGLTSNNPLVFDAEDPSGDPNSAFNTGNGRFTAPVAGWYQFDWFVQQGGASVLAASQWWYTLIKKNGTDFLKQGTIHDGTGVNYGRSGGSAMVLLAKDDYVEVILQFVATGTVTPGSPWTYFCGFLVP